MSAKQSGGGQRQLTGQIVWQLKPRCHKHPRGRREIDVTQRRALVVCAVCRCRLLTVLGPFATIGAG